MSRLVIGTNYNDSSPIVNKGNYYVEKTKYGLTVEGYIGNTDQDRMLQLPSLVGTPDFSKVKGFLRDNQFEYKFMNQQYITGTVKFGLTNPLHNYTLKHCFHNSTITGFECSDLVNLGNEGTFQSVCELCGNLTTVSFPLLETITGAKSFYRAFKSCSNLYTASFPNLTSISGEQVFLEAFYGCGHLSNLEFDLLETVSGYRACYRMGYQSHISNLSFPNLETITGNEVFMDSFFNCDNLVSISMPKLYTVEGAQVLCEAFSHTDLLETVDMHLLANVTGNSAMSVTFQNSSVETVNLGALVTVEGNSALSNIFEDCTNLSYIDVRDLTTLQGNSVASFAFANTPSLQTINFEDLDDIKGDNGAYYMFQNSGLTYIEFPSLYELQGINVCSNMFNGCTDLEYAQFKGGQLTIKNPDSTLETDAPFLSAFDGCSSMTELMFSSKINFSNCPTPGVFHYMIDGCTSLTDIWFDNLTTAGLGTLRNAYWQNMLNINDSRYSNMNPIRFHINREVRDTFRNGRTDAEIITSMGLPSGSSIVWGYKYIITASQSSIDTRYDRDPLNSTLTSLAWTKTVSGVTTTVYTKKIYQRTGTTSHCDGEPWSQHDEYYSDPECTNSLGYVYSVGG